ncbi:MAG: Threonine dehydrogenase and related Zn-dependent dehydrogenases, partial [uncultured Acetobacteraceae bacterium]
ESGRLPRHRRHPPGRGSRRVDQGADRRGRAAHGVRDLRHGPALRARHLPRREARHGAGPRGRGHRGRGRPRRAEPQARRPGGDPVHGGLRQLLVLPHRLLRAVRRRQPAGADGGHRVLRRPGGGGRPGRAAGRVRPRPLCLPQPHQAAGPRHRRPGDPDERHLSHGLLRRGARRGARRRRGRRVGLRPGGAVLRALGLPARRAPGHRRRRPARPAGARPPARRRDGQLQRGGPDRGDQGADARHRPGPGDRRRGRGERDAETGPGGAGRPRAGAGVRPAGPDDRLGRRAAGRAVEARRRAHARLGLGRQVARQGGHAGHHRRLPALGRVLPHRRGDEQEPHHQHGQLQPPDLHPEAGGQGRGRHDGPDFGAEQRRAHVGRHRGLQAVRPAPPWLDQGGAAAGAV